MLWCLYVLLYGWSEIQGLKESLFTLPFFGTIKISNITKHGSSSVVIATSCQFILLVVAYESTKVYDKSHSNKKWVQLDIVTYHFCQNKCETRTTCTQDTRMYNDAVFADEAWIDLLICFGRAFQELKLSSNESKKGSTTTSIVLYQQNKNSLINRNILNHFCALDHLIDSVVTIDWRWFVPSF